VSPEGVSDSQELIKALNHDKAVRQAKKALIKAMKQDASAAAKEEASAEIAKDFSWKAGTEKGKAEAYKEAYYKQRGRAAADNKMSRNLIHMRSKEGMTKSKVVNVHKQVVKLATQLKRISSGKAGIGYPGQLDDTKELLKKHEAQLAKIRAATTKAFSKDKVVGVKAVKVDKLKTQEKLVKIKNGRIVNEMQHDEKALSKAKALDKSKTATKQQKLHAMKGDVRSLMFLKALDSKTSGALSQVDELKRDIAKSMVVKKKQDAAKAAKNAAKTPKAATVELLQEEEEYPMSMESMGAEDQPELLSSSKESNMKLNAKTTCSCNGASNMRGHGANCKDWEGDGTAPWCYVGWGCDHGTPSGHMSGLKYITCTAAHKKEKNMVATAADQKIKPSLGEAGSDHASCGCTGTENGKAQGKSCKKWGSSDKKPWCYVSIDCSRATMSAEVAGARFVSGCDHLEELGEAEDSEAKAGVSMYARAKEQLGDALESRDNEGTRVGWSWGITLASNTPYPGCIEECKNDAACVGASYAVGEVAPTNPAGASVGENSCHQFAGITQRSKNPQYRTFLSGPHA